MERFCWIPSSLARARPKWDVKRGSLSLMTRLGNPNHRYTWSRYSLAIWGPVIVVVQGRKIAPREHPWLTMVRMASYPLLLGSSVMRSMATWENGFASGSAGILNSGVYNQWVRFLFCWHVAHPLTYSCIQEHALGQ